MFGRLPRAVLRMNDTADENGIYTMWNISADSIAWDHRGGPKPDADCLHGDVIMCLLAEQGIQGTLISNSRKSSKSIS